jgi:ADP-ribosylglycohydrolase
MNALTTSGMTRAQLERVRGSLLLSAIGDALGATNEFKTLGEVQRRGRVVDLVGGGWLNLPPGEVTDDTQMMRCILESYAHGYALGDVAVRFVAWLEGEPADVGVLTRHALEHVARGVNPRDAGRIAWEQSGFTSAGNGAIMRAAPTGALRAFDREARALETLEIARITHFDARCVESSVWLNACIAALIAGANVPETLESARLEVLWAREHCGLTTPSAEHDVLRWVRAAQTMRVEDLDTSGYTLATAQAAAWALIHSPELEGGLVAVVNQGGDADTIGAVAGALLGARDGINAIPARWLERLLCRTELEGLIERAVEQVAGNTD